MTTLNFSKLSQLQEFVKKHKPALYVGSLTSTVIDFQKAPCQIASLSSLPKEISWKTAEIVRVKGPVSWQELREFCHQEAREVPCWPTETSACVLAGLATSATGERSFAHGNLRDHIVSITYLNDEGELSKLTSKPLEDIPESLLKSYAESFRPYTKFKNAPFPRMEKQTDLMIGTEGQLGVIVECEMKTSVRKKLDTFAIGLSSWKKDYSAHLKLLDWVQDKRGDIVTCELIDRAALQFAKSDLNLTDVDDYIFLQIEASKVEHLFEQLLKFWPSPDHIIQMKDSEFEQLRLQVPRGIQEYLSKHHLQKKGTDVQVEINHLGILLDLYQQYAEQYKSHFLFGHFGDAHLHFNFLGSKDDISKIDQILDQFYNDLKKIYHSPFAEHGIGTLKQKYMQQYWGPVQREMFSFLKKKMDPYQQFFPQGFMNQK